jgi:hypothetical protein
VVFVLVVQAARLHSENDRKAFILITLDGAVDHNRISGAAPKDGRCVVTDDANRANLPPI